MCKPLNDHRSNKMSSRLTNNANLTISNQETFNGHPVQIHKGSLIEDYLTKIERTIQAALFEHPRTVAFRIDLRLPPNNGNNDSSVIGRFIESLKAQIKADLLKKQRAGKRVHPCTLRYVWVREQDTSLQSHYHVVLLLNNDTYNTLGSFNANEGNMSARIQKAWASALSSDVFQSGRLVHFAKNGTYIVKVNSPTYIQDLDNLFHRISYFAKVDTKVYGNRMKSFGCSNK